MYLIDIYHVCHIYRSYQIIRITGDEKFYQMENLTGCRLTASIIRICKLSDRFTQLLKYGIIHGNVLNLFIRIYL